MVPEKLARFLDQVANVAAAGSRDAKLVPHAHRVSGWRLDPDLKTLTVLVPEITSEHLVESLADNGQLAVTIEQFPSHETYQFKGKSRRTRPANDADRELVLRTRERWVRDLRSFFGPGSEEMLSAWVLDPSIAVELEIEAIFLQTPGPSAGTRLVPAPES